MFGKKKTRKKWHRPVGFIFSIVSLIVLTYVSVLLITGRPVNFAWLMGIFSSRTPIEIVDELLFDVGRDRVFADLGGSIASAGTLGIQVLDYSGNEMLREPFRMSRPAMSAVNSRAIAFDVGGTAVRVFDSGRMLSSVETSGAIISASINRNGWFSVGTQEGRGLRGVITVYNDRGNDVFRVNLGSGYAFASALSPDNRSLAVLNLTDVGSRITLYHGLNQVDYSGVFVLSGGLILDILFLPNGELLALSTNALIGIDRNGTGRELFDFFDKRLGGFILDDGTIVLHLLDYGIGHSGRLVRLDERGRLEAEVATNREIVSKSFSGRYLAVMYSDGVVFYDRNLEELPLYAQQASLAGTSRVLSLGHGVALATGEHVTVAVRREDRD
ncbi:MAG: DUF5711 family protein [Oscillospiraceae bacterium]|nr:DUF5711 family protein [Oscillospiraceae bacterium]